jgi:hypothetical protein
MSRIMCVSSTKVKATRHSARLAAPFGAGLTRYVPDAGRMPFTQADLDWAAAAFADDAGPDYDRLAGEAAFLASYEAMTPPPTGICRSCGQPAETLTYGYCDACDEAGTQATIKGANGRAGLGYRVH